MSEARSTIVMDEDGAKISFQQARLLVEDGPDVGEELLLSDRPVVVGRGEEVDLVLDDPGVSRAHLVLQPSRGGWKVRDLDSSTGTFINGVQVEVAPLPPGARLRIGETELMLRVGEVEVRAPGASGADMGGMVGDSPQSRQLFGLVRRVAQLEMPVLLIGESGTGKEGLARNVHRHSGRAEGPYEVVDCTLLDREHLRSELFGHVKGAFTGADSARDGAFVRADGGTLFLDEIGELPLDLQPVLLRVLEEGEVRPLGGGAAVRTRVRLVAATNRDLAASVAAGEFRSDLYYRISALLVPVPPLREREGDAVAIAESFLEPGFDLTPEAREAIAEYPWPGNVRELRNVMQRACGLCSSQRIGVRDLHLPEPGAAPPVGVAVARAGGRGAVAAPAAARRAPAPAAGRRGSRLADYEEQAILEALEACGGNRRQAAKRLGIARSTLYRKLKELGVD